MAVLYLTEQGAVVRKTGERLIVEKDHQVLAEIPCLKLETILIYGNVQVTTQALAELLDQGIELAYLSRSGRLRGQLTPPKAKNIHLRVRQFHRAGEPGFCLAFARAVVRAKMENALAFARRSRRNDPSRFPQEEIEALSRPPRRSSALRISTPCAAWRGPPPRATSGRSERWCRSASASRSGTDGRRAIR